MKSASPGFSSIAFRTICYCKVTEPVRTTQRARGVKSAFISVITALIDLIKISVDIVEMKYMHTGYMREMDRRVTGGRARRGRG